MISHKLKEVIAIADKATILRDGKTICTLDASKGEIQENIIIKHMVGREIDDVFPKRDHKNIGNAILEIKNWTAYDQQLGREVVKKANIYVRKGEIVGIAGLMGSGRTELAQSIFGNPKQYRLEGELLVDGMLNRFKHPRDAIKAGVAYVTE